MSLGVSKPKPYTKERVPYHVSKLSRPKLDFHTHIVFIHIFMVPYSNFIHPYFHTNIHSSILKFHSSLPVIFFFLLFFSLLLLLLLLPFSSLLSYPFFALSFSKTKMRYLFWSYPYLILSPFYFTFQGGNFLPLSFKPLVSSTIFFLILF